MTATLDGGRTAAVTLRLVVGAALLVVGLVLGGLGVSAHGKPWGYRGHAAALIEATHNVELVPSSARAERERLDDALLPRSRGTFLDAGDSVRTGVHSEARLALPGALLVVGDRTRATLTERGARLAQGALEVTVSRGAAPFVLETESPAAEVRLRAAEVEGVFRVFADGKSEARVLVRAGSAEPASGAAAPTVTAGKVLALGADKVLRTEDPPTSLTVVPTCVAGRVTVVAPPATQLFVDGEVLWPEAEKVSVATVPAHPQRSHVFGRDVAGNVAPVVEVACVAQLILDPVKPRAPGAPAPKGK